MICANNEFQIYYLVIARFITNYKGQIVIVIIKLRIDCLTYIILVNKYKNLNKNRLLQIYKKLQT